jgi:hypothetical protein
MLSHLLLELSFIGGYRPVNKEELFNLRHALARNVIERIFGVLKRRFRILLLAPEYSLEIQAWIPAALCTIHNFIRTHDVDENVVEPDLGDDEAQNDHDHDHIASAAAAAELDRPSARRDHIAQQMWDDYVCICNERGIEDQEEDEEDGEADKEDGGADKDEDDELEHDDE